MLWGLCKAPGIPVLASRHQTISVFVCSRLAAVFLFGDCCGRGGPPAFGSAVSAVGWLFWLETSSEIPVLFGCWLLVAAPAVVFWFRKPSIMRAGVFVVAGLCAGPTGVMSLARWTFEQAIRWRSPEGALRPALFKGGRIPSKSFPPHLMPRP